MTYLNGILITPVYLRLFKLTDSISFLATIEKWDEVSKNFLGDLKLPYWTFILSVYTPFNLANFSLESILALPIYVIVDHFLKKRIKN